MPVRIQRHGAGRLGLAVAAGVNVLLLGALALPSGDSAGTARAAQPGLERDAAPIPNFRPPGRYRAVSGDTGSGNTHAIWVLDEVNHELIAVRWDASRERLDVIGYRDILADAQARAPR